MLLAATVISILFHFGIFSELFSLKPDSHGGLRLFVPFSWTAVTGFGDRRGEF